MSKSKIFLAIVAWIILLFLGVMLYRFFVVPSQEQKKVQEQIEAKKDKILKTSANSKSLETVNIHLDSFSGYAIYRSDVFKEECAKRGVRVNLVDDGGKFVDRIQNLSSGKCDMALFTIDAFIKSSAKIRDMPGTIVWISDESHGADAIVGNAKTAENIDSLNDAQMKIVATADSPSETLSLIVRDNFNLEKSSPTVFLNDIEEVYNDYKNSKPSDKKVYVLWEPYVSKVLENKDYKILIDSEKFRDYIVDAMVASRDFLVKHPKKVQVIAEAYFASLYRVKSDMKSEFARDDKSLTAMQVERMVNCIQFKNTQENYAHFGLLPGYNLQNIESIISEILSLQLRSKVIEFDPSNQNFNLWYFPGVLTELQKSDFRPGLENIQQDNELPTLSEQEWQKLKPVGSLQVPKLVFRRGSSTISSGSEKTLEDLVLKLNKWTAYYLVIKGNSSSEGDPEANRILAEGRANSTKDWLISHGVNPNRIKVDEIKPNGSTTVNFILAENPY